MLWKYTLLRALLGDNGGLVDNGMTAMKLFETVEHLAIVGEQEAVSTNLQGRASQPSLYIVWSLFFRFRGYI